MLGVLEMIGLVTSYVGALIIVVPNFVTWLDYLLCCNNERKKKKKVEDNIAEYQQEEFSYRLQTQSFSEGKYRSMNSKT